MMRVPTPVRFVPLLVVTTGLWAGLCFGQDLAAEGAEENAQLNAVVETSEPVAPPTAIVPRSELDSMTAPLLRMVLSLAAVLALVGAFAWVAKRFRGGQMQGGLIQIVSGLSLGPKDRVVLLRVGHEEVLVGLSPTGMRALHVMDKPASAAGFSLNMAEQNQSGSPPNVSDKAALE
jgi:flagellar biosynthetic protein FliO